MKIYLLTTHLQIFAVNDFVKDFEKCKFICLKTTAMKKIYTLLSFVFIIIFSNAQNIGVGTNIPVQTLDVNGAIKIGNSNNNQAGSIRYNSGNIEVGNGSSWNALVSLPSKAVIISQAADTASIKAGGYSVLRQMDLWDTASITVSTNYSGAWSVGFPTSVTPPYLPPPASAEAVIYGKDFIYFGNDGYVYDYSIAAQTWTKLPNVCPLTTRYNCGVTLVGSVLYVTGGWKYSGGEIFYSDCAKYDLGTNTWSAMASIPVTNAYHSTAAIGTDIYLLNGFSNSTYTNITKLYRYNTLTNTWSANIAGPGTPPFTLYAGGMVAWNNKLVWHNSTLKIYAYDPVAGTSTDMNPSTSPVSFEAGYKLTLNGNKLYLAANIIDTTTLDPTFNTVPVQYEIDLITGATTKINSCQLQGDVYLYQYSPYAGKIYCRNFDANHFIFDPTASQSCNTVIKRKGYWFYMKKN